ncbi:MAG: hypothetical protein ACK4P3_09255 [Fimbriimonadaceae bacterium]
MSVRKIASRFVVPPICSLICALPSLSAPAFTDEVMLNGAESYLLGNRRVQISIGIDRSMSPQMTRANELVDRSYRQYNDLFSGDKTPSRDQITRYRAFIAHFERLRVSLLSENQIRRLRQVSLQRAGVYGLLSQPLITELKLSRKQHSAVNEIATQFHLARLHSTAALFRSEGLLSTTPILVTASDSSIRLRTVERRRSQRLEQIRIEYLNRALSQLTIEQRRRYWALVGAPFRFE